MAGGSRRNASGRVNPCLEFGPSILGDFDLGTRNRAGVLAEDVEEDHQAPGAAVEDPVVLPTVMAPQLAELSLNLRAVRKRKVRLGGREHVQPIDLIVECHLALRVQPIDEVVYRLGAVSGAVVDGLKLGHNSNVGG
jgi:hypothetical protein